MKKPDLLTFIMINEVTLDSVDGSEIRRSPVEVGSFSDYLQGLLRMPPLSKDSSFSNLAP